MNRNPFFDPAIHHRQSIRLAGYDYSHSGAYFVTICSHAHTCLLGEMGAGAGLEPAPTMRLNDYGEIVQFTWNDLVNHITGIELGPSVVMPNHVHGIIVIVEKTKGLSEIVRQFKTFSARRINEKRGTPGEPVWQRNYYEHIIRDEYSYNQIALYITNNPTQWQQDPLFS